jgi:hypothetical protein
MRCKPKISALALAATTVAISLIWSAFDSRSDQRASQRNIQQLQANIDELKTELRRRSTLAHVADATMARGVTSLAQPKGQAETPQALDDQPTTDEVTSMSFEQSQASVFEAFGHEGIDSHWSGDAARKLETSIRDRLPQGSHLGSVECHSTMCRIEVYHVEPNGVQTFIMDAFRDWGGSLFVAKDRVEQGEHVATIIASREGHELPLAPR